MLSVPSWPRLQVPFSTRSALLEEVCRCPILWRPNQSTILAARLIGAANAEEVVALDLLSIAKTVLAQMFGSDVSMILVSSVETTSLNAILVAPSSGVQCHPGGLFPDVRHGCYHDCRQLRRPRLQVPLSSRSAQLEEVCRCQHFLPAQSPLFKQEFACNSTARLSCECQRFSVTTDLGAADAVEIDVSMFAFSSDFVHVCK